MISNYRNTDCIVHDVGLDSIAGYPLERPCSLRDLLWPRHRPDLHGDEQLPHRCLRYLLRVCAGFFSVQQEHRCCAIAPARYVPNVRESWRRLGLQPAGVYLCGAIADPVCFPAIRQGFEEEERFLSTAQGRNGTGAATGGAGIA